MRPRATTVKQSRKLIQLGLDPKTCDFVYIEEEGPFVFTGDEHDLDGRTMLPAWSLGALLALLPYGALYLNSKSIGWCVSFAGRVYVEPTMRKQNVLDAVCEIVEHLMECGCMLGREVKP